MSDVPTDPDSLLALVGMEDGQPAGSVAHRALEIGYQQMRERAEQAERTRDDLRAALRGVVEDVLWEPASLTDSELAIFERARAALAMSGRKGAP